MSYVFIVLILIVTAIFFYQRHSPPYSIDTFDHVTDHHTKGRWILDIREYQDALRRPAEGSLNVPLAYLKRHFPKKMPDELILIANDRIEVNLASRFLESKGYTVIGCQICPADFPNKEKYSQTKNLQEPCRTTSC